MITPDIIEPPFECKMIELDGREIYVPYLPIVMNGMETTLNYFNSLVRTFPDSFVDHLETHLDGKLKGVRLDHEIIEMCIAYEFPRRFDPYVDEATSKWLAEVSIKNIDAELDDL